MEIIDLVKTGKSKVEKIIHSNYGGKTHTSKLGIHLETGISGLIFIDPESGTSFKVSLTIYKKGIGIYCRNYLKNYLIAIKNEEIKSFEIEQFASVLQPKSWSLYSLMKKVGTTEQRASNYLMPVEIIEHHHPTLRLTTENKILTFDLSKAKVHKIIELLKKPIYEGKLKSTIQNPIII